MKKTVLLVLLSTMVVSGLFAEFNINQKASDRNPFRIDAGLSLSWGFFDTSEFGEFSDEVGFLASLLSLRSGITGSFRYSFGPMSAGVQTGLLALNLEIEDNYGNTETYTMTDVPMLALFRIGPAGTFVEAQAGYYFTFNDDLDGFMGGIKLSLGGAYIEAAYVFRPDFEYQWLRIGIGYQFNNLLAF